MVDVKKMQFSKSISPVISPGVTQLCVTLAEFRQLLTAEEGNQTYARYANPTLTGTESFLEENLHGEKALVFASGMAAITTSVLALTQPGTRIFYGIECYRKTDDFFQLIAGKFNLDVKGLSAEEFNHRDLRNLVENDQPIIFFIETPTNPLLKLIDVERLSSELKRLRIRKQSTIIVDSTMATPFLFRPREMGADLEIHSATKYLGGFDDLFAGIITGSVKLLKKVQNARSIFGGISSPADLTHLQQSMKTFEIRMQALSQRGLATAEFLKSQPKINTVYYPGLPSSPDYPLAFSWAKSAGREVKENQPIPFGSVVSFAIADNPDKIESFANQIGHLGVNFGGVHTVLDPFGDRISPKFRQQLGINAGLFRLSAGLDYSQDEIISLLEKGLTFL